jgi:hypothetical protein
MALQGPLVVKGVLVSNAYVQFFRSNLFPPHSVKGFGSVFFNKEQAIANTANVLDSVKVVCDYIEGVDPISLLDNGALLQEGFANMNPVDDIDNTPPDMNQYKVTRINATSGTGFD